jgi:leucyl aminopeptidase
MITESIDFARQFVNDLQKVYTSEELVEFAKNLSEADRENSYATHCVMNLILERHFK